MYTQKDLSKVVDAEKCLLMTEEEKDAEFAKMILESDVRFVPDLTGKTGGSMVNIKTGEVVRVFSLPEGV
jgi:hypothetical protein